MAAAAIAAMQAFMGRRKTGLTLRVQFGPSARADPANCVREFFRMALLDAVFIP
jgi:hypothetical protein